MLHTLATKQLKAELSTPLNTFVLLTCLLFILYFSYEKYDSHTTEQTEAANLILSPQVNDIYFLDFRLFSDKLISKHKYKLAKVIRVTEDSIVIVYGSFFYQWQHAVVNSIEYGDLMNRDYFTQMPEYISFAKIKEMKRSGAIYLVKRPIQNTLYGNFVSPE